MESKKIADRYIAALFPLAIEQKKHEEVGADLAALKQAVQESTDLQKVLSNPVVESKELTTVFEALLEKAQGGDLTRNFIKTLIANKRIQVLVPLADEYISKLMEHKGEMVAEVVTARPLKSAQEKKIKTLLEKSTGKTIHMHLKEDPTILGGMIIQLGSRMLDRSVAGKLKRLKANLTLSGA